MRWIPGQRSSWQRKAASIGIVKLMMIMAASTLLLLVVVGLGSYVQAKLVQSPSLTKKGLTSSMSSNFFMDMLALEARSLPTDRSGYTFSGNNVANFLVQLLIDVNPLDPKSLLASELPGMSGKQPTVLRTSSIDPSGPAPQDYSPKPGGGNDKGATENDGEPGNEQINEVAWEELEWDFLKVQEIVDNRHTITASITVPNPVHHPALSQTRKVFIYHSHSRESFLPELESVTKPSEAFDAKKNVSLLGNRLSAKLTDLGVSSLSSETDYPTSVKDYNWNFSYKYSLQTVKEAFAANPDLEYFIDIHRDSAGRKVTTKEFDGKSYARVAFVVGQENPNWEQNDAFAAQIHKKLEAKYPGLSRGTWGKDGKTGHGEYNQSVSPNSILIEVGGVDNTLEECYRTIDALARVISEIVMDATIVSQPLPIDKEAS